MPFEPRLVRLAEMPPDDVHELPLPPDLGLLAEQLADDANHLAACYPPPNRLGTLQPEPLRKELFPRRATLMLGGSLAAIALVAGIATLAVWPRGELAPPQAVFPQAVAVQRHDSSSDAEATAERPVFVGEFSLPALEGLLDLREGSPDVASVAF